MSAFLSVIFYYYPLVLLFLLLIAIHTVIPPTDNIRSHTNILLLSAVSGVSFTSAAVSLASALPEEIAELKKVVCDAGLGIAGIESVNVSDDIKIGTAKRDEHIDNYIKTLQALGEADIHMVCYNFMPVFDWTRSELARVRKDGSTVLAYNQDTVDMIDPEHMKESVEKMSNGFVMPGWEPERLDRLKELFEMYSDVDAEKLFNNLVYFLEAIGPVCEKYDIKMGIHPDDPAWPIFGLPRIMTGKDSVTRLLDAVDKPYNGITLCTGSFGSNQNNDLCEIIKACRGRIPFAHVRNLKYNSPRDFEEAAHLSFFRGLVL